MYAGLHTSDSVDWGQPVNWAHGLNRGLVAWWLAVPNRMGWRSTVWRDLCRYHTGTLTSMDYATDWVPSVGRRGGVAALELDGTNDHVVLTSAKLAALVGSGIPWSLALWEKSTYEQFSGSLVIGGSGLVHTKNTKWGVINGNNVIRVCGVAPSSTEWKHVVVSVPSDANYALGAESTSVGIYVNGASSIGTFTTDNGYGLSGVYYLGRGFSGSVTAGQWDDVRVWNRALSASEAAAVYQESMRGNSALLNRIRLPHYSAEQSAATFVGCGLTRSRHLTRPALVG